MQNKLILFILIAAVGIFLTIFFLRKPRLSHPQEPSGKNWMASALESRVDSRAASVIGATQAPMASALGIDQKNEKITFGNSGRGVMRNVTLSTKIVRQKEWGSYDWFCFILSLMFVCFSFILWRYDINLDHPLAWFIGCVLFLIPTNWWLNLFVLPDLLLNIAAAGSYIVTFIALVGLLRFYWSRR